MTSDLPRQSTSRPAPRTGMLIEQKCHEFEEAWSRGDEPDLEEFLTGVQDSKQKELFEELLALELELRLQAGTLPESTAYQSRFPQFADIIDEVYREYNHSVQTTLNSDTGMGSGFLPVLPSLVDEEPVLFGDYLLLEQVARGGMGVVYKARQLNLNREVALKMILAGQLAGEHEIQRFYNEARANGRLSHENIVRVYEVGEYSGLHFYSMDFIEGRNLSDRLRDQPLTPYQSAELVKQIALGVEYAHQQGVLHRDIKPSNVIVDDYGVPRIYDFGLAKQQTDSEVLTLTGQVLGTPSYMPPEQAMGDTARIGAASDVYGLGALLYTCLTGAPPFQGNTIMETLRQVQEQPPVPPSRLSSCVPRDLETVCLKCLEKAPEHRYHSAAALAVDLDRFLTGKPVRARPLSRITRAVRSVRQHPRQSLIWLSLAVLMMIAAGMFLSLKHRLDTQQEDINQAQHREQTLHSNQAVTLTTPPGLPPVSIPSDNPLTEAKIYLGHQLFFDPRLSGNGEIACATCHHPKTGWTISEPIALKVEGEHFLRNPPTLINAAYQRFFFWDGRASNFEQQALGPLLNPLEMKNSSVEALEKRIRHIPGYRKQFEAVFGQEGVTAENLSKALAAFERTIMSGNAPYDQFRAGNPSALSPAAERGMKLFFNKAQCSACHSGPTFSDGAFHNIGIGMQSEKFDPGRSLISHLEGDRGAFRTPPLREVAKTAPYMHDGSLKTLEEVVAYYNKGGHPNPYLDEEIFPLDLTPEEQQDLVRFLREGLSSPDYPDVPTPALP